MIITHELHHSCLPILTCDDFSPCALWCLSFLTCDDFSPCALWCLSFLTWDDFSPCGFVMPVFCDLIFFGRKMERPEFRQLPELLHPCYMLSVSIICMTNKGLASPLCQEGQSERTFPIFAISSQFFLFFLFFPSCPDFSLFFQNFPSFWQFFLCQGRHSAPPPNWLRYWWQNFEKS